MSPDALHVDASNAEQMRAWNEGEGQYWAAHADYFDRSARAFHRRVLAAAAIGENETVLDIGCGTGQTTLHAAQAATAGSALGVDLSAPMLERARKRAADEGVRNVSFEQADAQVHPFEPASFDVAISSMGAMFFGDLVAAYTNIGRALRPGGRLAILTWRAMSENEWLREYRGALAVGRDLPVPPVEAQSPFALSDADRDRDILTAAGFTDVELEAAQERMWFGADTEEAKQAALGVFGWLLDDLDNDNRARALDALEATLDAHHTADGVIYDSSVWVITATHP
jgi:SAM-dependent methyltransferase